jgi:hypothetical protein
MFLGRRLVAAVAIGLVALVAGCGGDDSDKTAKTPQGADYGAIKSYLLSHSADLEEQSAQLRANAERYYALAKAANFDYARLLRERRSELQAWSRQAKEHYRAANPAYEEMEGVVAGVPELADFDVIIDAGGDASDPENAVPFSVKTPAGRTFKQPGNYFLLMEAPLYGTEPKWAAKGVKPDLDGDGRVEFGEALPDADFYVAAARGFAEAARDLDSAARKWQPSQEDVFNALVVMTPTMSEYFESWKNSRFVAGGKAQERAFVASSRLSDITDIFSGLVLIYDRGAKAQIAGVNRQQADQTGEALQRLQRFAARLRDREASGTKFTPEQADAFGSEAQSQAEAVAGQVSQAAGRLGIELQS